MSRAVFLIERAGPMTTIQDRGRFGAQRYGINEAGPMDRAAYRTALAALGEAPGPALIETSLGGMALRCIQGDITVALAGGGFRLTIDGETKGSWCVATLRAGQRLEIKPGPWGSWTCLAIAGDIVATPWMGSVATHVPTGFGAGVLKTNDEVVIDNARVLPEREGLLPFPVTGKPRDHVRVVLGPQQQFFTPATIEQFLDTGFTLSGEYDRMGVKLIGAKIPIEGALDMPSQALPRGSVQIPGHGDPLILLSDHQTTGGYPKIAVTIGADQDGFCQLRPRQSVRFSAITPEDAIIAARSRAKAENAYLDRLRRRTNA
jgi:allophanate hydrolase